MKEILSQNQDIPHNQADITCEDHEEYEDIDENEEWSDLDVTQMELEGAKRCFSFIQEKAKLSIPVFISDRHSGISKWIREQHPNTKHLDTRCAHYIKYFTVILA